LVELGAGSASKTQVLIEALLRRQLRADFYPVDVSSSALQGALATLNGHFPRLRVSPIVADYTHRLPDLKSLPGRKLVLFIGSTIGNFEPEEAEEFLKSIRRSLQPGDALLIGFDLIKDADVLHAAYNDAQGVTAAFNKNMLVRINRELGGNFDLEAFDHQSVWNAGESRIEMHLVARRAEQIEIPAAQTAFAMRAGDRIWTESSYKYSPDEVIRLLEAAGFALIGQWIDHPDRFAMTLVEAVA
jgi:dimethylhistidine N-methyltransferase